MKKFLSLLVISMLLFTLVIPAGAKPLKDVPNSHWAKDYVYELVNMGVTTGYPDGTFRGSKNISRYEVAVMMSKLANVLEGQTGGSPDKIKKIVREEINAANQGKAEGWKLSGYFKLRALGNKVLTTAGSRLVTAQQRLVLNVAKDLGKDAKVGIDLDTRTSANDYLPWDDYDIFQAGAADVWATARVEDLFLPLNFMLSNGNGDAFHKKSMAGVMSDSYATDWGACALGAAVYSRGTNLTANTNKVSGVLEYANIFPWINKTLMTLDLSTFFTGSNPLGTGRHINWLLSGISELDSKWKVEGRVGASSTQSSGYYVAAKTWLTNYWGTGTDVYLGFHKIGKNYLRTTNSDTYVDVNVLEQLISANGVLLEANVSQVIDSKWNTGLKVVANFTGSGLGTVQTSIWEPVLELQANAATKLYGKYRYTLNHVTSSSSTDRLEGGVQVNF